MDEVKPVARVPTVEHREPCESRGSRTVLGAPGGEIPPGDSTKPEELKVSTMSPVYPTKQTLLPLSCMSHSGQKRSSVTERDRLSDDS